MLQQFQHGGFSGKTRVSVAALASLIIVGMFQQCLTAHTVLFDIFLTESGMTAEILTRKGIIPVINDTHQKLMDEFKFFILPGENSGQILHRLSAFYKTLLAASFLTLLFCFLPARFNALKIIHYTGTGYFLIANAVLSATVLYFWEALIGDTVFNALFFNLIIFVVFWGYSRFDKTPDINRFRRDGIKILFMLYAGWAIFAVPVYARQFIGIYLDG